MRQHATFSDMVDCLILMYSPMGWSPTASSNLVYSVVCNQYLAFEVPGNLRIFIYSVCWDGVQKSRIFLSAIPCFFKIEACDRIDHNSWCSYYWKNLVGSGILDTCCGWFAICVHYFTYLISRVSRCGVSTIRHAVIIGVCYKDGINLVDYSSSHTLVSKIKRWMSKCI